MQRIQSIITEALHTLYGIESSPEITWAPKREYGEYCINVFPLAKPLGKSPNIIASEVALELAKYTEVFTSTSATGGYVNFFLTDSVWLWLFSVIASETKWSTAIQVLQKQNTRFLPTQEWQKGNPPIPLSQGGIKPTIIVDYIGANAGKPLHIGHICTPSIGQTICNVYRHLGYRVIGDSHFGDWGGIFGKLICAYKLWQLLKPECELSWEEQIRYRLLNDLFNREYDDTNISSEVMNAIKQFLSWVPAEATNAKYIKYLYYCYITFTFVWEREPEFEKQFRIEFKLLSEWNEKNKLIWQKFTWGSIYAIEWILNFINVHATYNIGESFYEWLGLPRPNGEDYPDLEFTMKDIIAELIEKWIATQNEDGSVGVIFPEATKVPSCVLQKKDGTGLYLTSDLAAIKYRLTNGWNPEKIIYSVDVRQQLHLKQAFTIAKMAWWEELRADAVEFTHAHNGFIKLKEWAMSTRHGTVIFLEALIEEWLERTRKILEEKWRTLSDENIEAITIAAIKYSYLAQDREKDVTFDWDKALNFEGNSWPYIQYAYVRARKISNSDGIRHPEQSEGSRNHEAWILHFTQNDNKSRLSNNDKSLIQILTRMDEAIDLTAKTYKPHHLALYAYDLAVGFNSFYVHTPKILEESDKNLKQFRLAIVSHASQQLETIFHLLGINMPSEM